MGEPASAAAAPDLKINWNPVTETWRNLDLARQQPAVFRSILGISWMWFFGAVFLAQFPAFAHDVLRGNEQVASALLAVFSIGIGVGSLACEKLSRGRVEMGFVKGAPFEVTPANSNPADLMARKFAIEAQQVKP